MRKLESLTFILVVTAILVFVVGVSTANGMIVMVAGSMGALSILVSLVAIVILIVRTRQQERRR